jgi:hypothetical protein
MRFTVSGVPVAVKRRVVEPVNKVKKNSLYLCGDQVSRVKCVYETSDDSQDRPKHVREFVYSQKTSHKWRNT